jgi:hypothetical protein
MRASLIASSNISRKALVGHVARTGEKRNARRILMGKVEGKRQIARARRRLQDSIKMVLKERG